MKYNKLLDQLSSIKPFSEETGKAMLSSIEGKLDKNKIPKNKRGDYVNYIAKHLYYVSKIGLVFYRLFELPATFLEQLRHHDDIKFTPEAWISYYDHFYGSKKGKKDNAALNMNWVEHVHHNKHHWNYWAILDDDGMTVVEMPRLYVFEMIADWMSVGKSLRDNYDVKVWLEERKPKIILHPKTKAFIKSTFGLDIRNELKS